MAERANVTSTEALERFRTSLIIYIDKMGSALNEIGEEVRRTRQWIEEDRQRHHMSDYRRKSQKLDEAEQELYSASLGGAGSSPLRQKMEVAKARRAKEDVERKLRVLKKWSRDFDGVVEPRARKLESIRSFLASDMAKAVAYMTEAVKALESYAELRAPSAPEISTGEGGEEQS